MANDGPIIMSACLRAVSRLAGELLPCRALAPKRDSPVAKACSSTCRRELDLYGPAAQSFEKIRCHIAGWRHAQAALEVHDRVTGLWAHDAIDVADFIATADQ